MFDIVEIIAVLEYTLMFSEIDHSPSSLYKKRSILKNFQWFFYSYLSQDTKTYTAPTYAVKRGKETVVVMSKVRN